MKVDSPARKSSARTAVAFLSSAARTQASHASLGGSGTAAFFARTGRGAAGFLTADFLVAVVLGFLTGGIGDSYRYRTTIEEGQ